MNFELMFNLEFIPYSLIVISISILQVIILFGIA